jgi:hypothetical protein
MRLAGRAEPWSVPLKIAAIFAASGYATFGLPSGWGAEYDGILLGHP